MVVESIMFVLLVFLQVYSDLQICEFYSLIRKKFPEVGKGSSALKNAPDSSDVKDVVGGLKVGIVSPEISCPNVMLGC